MGAGQMRTRKKSALAAAVLASGVVIRAATVTWDNDGAGAPAGGSGVWNTTSANWWNGTSYVAWNNATPDNADFPSVPGTLTLGTSITANTMAFEAGDYV